MFAPDDREVLREALRPEPGETLVHAVGTTFSLDLSAALTVPLAFAAHALHNSAEPTAVLESLRSAADRLDIFCQCGTIRAPRTPSDLVAFLEPMVHEVRAPQHQQGYLFHPKVWVARYEADGEETFRLICATRNLTDSAAWDAVVRLDGRQYGKRTDVRNRPLMDLVRALPTMAVRQLDPARVQRIDELAEALGPVEWEPPAALGNVSIAFHALGLRRTRDLPEIVNSLSGSRQLVISPFIDDDALTTIADGSATTILVSRAEGLDRLSPDTLTGLDCRVVRSDAALDVPDDDITVNPDHGILGGLHAKMYVVESAKQAALLIGSANATAAGLFGHNVEFMVEFRGGRKALGIDLFLDPASGLGGLLESYPAQGGATRNEQDEAVRALDRTLRMVAATTFTATITPQGDRFTETVHAADSLSAGDPRVRLQLGVYGLPARTKPVQNGERTWTFDDLAITEVSAFLVVTASIGDGASQLERSTLIRADLIGDPSTRRDEILAKQFSTTEQFLRFLALLLGLADGSALISDAGTGGGAGAWQSFGSSTGLFELLVNAVATKPRAIDDLTRLVERLQQTDSGRKVLPPGFASLWSAISEAHTKLGSHR